MTPSDLDWMVPFVVLCPRHQRGLVSLLHFIVRETASIQLENLLFVRLAAGDCTGVIAMAMFK
jgi:hypothetical protein